MTTTYLVDGKPMTEAEFAQRLRERYMEILRKAILLKKFLV